MTDFGPCETCERCLACCTICDSFVEPEPVDTAAWFRVGGAA